MSYGRPVDGGRRCSGNVRTARVREENVTPKRYASHNTAHARYARYDVVVAPVGDATIIDRPRPIDAVAILSAAFLSLIPVNGGDGGIPTIIAIPAG